MLMEQLVQVDNNSSSSRWVDMVDKRIIRTLILATKDTTTTILGNIAQWVVYQTNQTC